MRGIKGVMEDQGSKVLSLTEVPRLPEGARGEWGARGMLYKMFYGPHYIPEAPDYLDNVICDVFTL